MPLHPSVRHLYMTEEWRQIRHRILKRSGYRCAWCGKPDRDSVLVAENGSWCRDEKEGWFNMAGKSVPEPLGKKGIQFVVVTIAHLNHVAGDNRDENLEALCGRCHLTHDGMQHRLTRARRQRETLRNLELELEPPREDSTPGFH